VAHPDISARIRSMQIVYKDDEQEQLPFIVLASSNGAIQVWDLANFNLDGTAESIKANESLVPVATSKLYGTALVTCISAGRVNTSSIEVIDSTKESSGAVNKATKKKRVKSAAITPTIVVEMDEGRLQFSLSLSLFSQTQYNIDVAEVKKSKKKKNKKKRNLNLATEAPGMLKFYNYNLLL